jgi:hypothetical protein
MDNRSRRKIKKLIKLVRKASDLAEEVNLFTDSSMLKEVEKSLQDTIIKDALPPTLKFDTDEEFENALIYLKQTDKKAYEKFMKLLEQTYG